VVVHRRGLLWWARPTPFNRVERYAASLRSAKYTWMTASRVMFAVIDRLVHHAIIFEMNVESRR
jgi:hypothetical protein